MTKILRFPCNLARTMRNTLREFLIVIATVAKVSCKHGLWLVVRVNYNRVGGDLLNPRPLTPPCVPFGTRRFNQLN